METITNNIPRDILSGFELTEKEKSEFDWMSSEEINENSFFRYKGRVYSLCEFMRFDPPNEWHGYHGETFFSAIVIKFVDDCESVIVGHQFST